MSCCKKTIEFVRKRIFCAAVRICTRHSVTADYKSFIGFGAAQKVTDFEEKVKGLNLLLQYYSARDCALRTFTVVYKVILTEFSGKQRFSDR